MPDIEAIGDAVTGGLVGRAVEPGAGEGDGHTHEGACLNCGCELVGEFCYCCGQHAHVHRTVGAWWHDFLHSVLHLDGKFWRTLPMLAWRPGELTRRYALGERAKFISPLALFLFTVFLMFAVFSLLGGPFDGSPSGVEAGSEATRDLRAEITSREQQEEALKKERADLAAKGEPTARVDAKLKEVDQELQAIETARRLVLVPNSAPEGQTRTVNMRETKVNTGWKRLDHAIEKALKNPDLLLYKVKANAYKFSWALIPISVPFVWILFLHRRRYRHDLTVYDHLVFVTYSIAFMSLWLVGWALVTSLGLDNGLVGFVLLLVAPAHIYRQLKGAYGLSRFGAAWRTAALLLFAAVALGLFGLLLLALGAGLL